jgi:16S rRNA (cytosine1402-N4)-methyltransferase
VPVLLNEAVDILLSGYKGTADAVFVDGTFGSGGYSKRILNYLNRKVNVIGIDRDANVLSYARNIINEYSSCLKIIIGNFADIGLLLEQNGTEKIDGIVLDLGLSTYQLDYEDGFSYLKNTLLDMRTGKDLKVTAADVLNKYDRESLWKVFRDYGEVRNYKKIVSEIIECRNSRRFETTGDVFEIFRKKIPQRFLNRELSKIFQAIRIEVNNELNNLKKCLSDVTSYLKPDARIVVVSYHSLEDRIVKHFFRDKDRLEVITKKPLMAGDTEVLNNPRSRSAKLRAARKLNEKQ